jgi:flagellar motor switch protein FliM
MGKKKLRKFRFSGLPKLTREQARVGNALLSFLPQTPFEIGFKDEVRKVLEPLVKADVDVWFDTLTHVPEDRLSGHILDPTCVVRVGLLPKPQEMLLEFDLVVAQEAIDRLMGGDAESVDASRALSDIEEGVFTFLMLKVLDLVQKTLGNEHQMALRLKGFHGSAASVAAATAGTGDWVCASFKLFFDLTVGFFRIYLPRSLVETDMLAPLPDDGPALTRVLQRTALRANRVAAIEVPIHVEAGRIPFAAADLQQLEGGDIVLIEDAQVRLVEGALEGPVESRVGLGHHGLIQGSLAVGESGKYEVVIEQILAAGVPEPAGGAMEGGEMAEMADEEHARGHAAAPEEARDVAARARAALAERALTGELTSLPVDRAPVVEPQAEHDEGEDDGEYEEGAYEDEGEYDEEPLPESAGLLGDVNIPMIIELGRVAVTAADVVQLRPGQVIELARSPGDPVDLVVDGRRIGRGELVEIEGELGVRIIELVK